MQKKRRRNGGEEERWSPKCTWEPREIGAVAGQGRAPLVHGKGRIYVAAEEEVSLCKATGGPVRKTLRPEGGDNIMQARVHLQARGELHSAERRCGMLW